MACSSGVAVAEQALQRRPRPRPPLRLDHAWPLVSRPSSFSAFTLRTTPVARVQGQTHFRHAVSSPWHGVTWSSRYPGR